MLRALSARPHRYRRLRRWTVSISLTVLFAIPATHLVRFDAWRGEHWLLFDRTDGITAGGAVLLAIAGFYLVTFVLNAGLGRILCGWGCPVAQVSRLGEGLSSARRKWSAWAAALAFDALFAAGILSWLVGPRVLVEGSARAIAWTAGVFIALAGGIFLFGATWRWGFCRKACPIGLYYSVVQTSHRFGIQFEGARCIDCGKCTEACPVGLEPRELERPIDHIGGLAIDGLPARHHCLTCGDCVRACEFVLKKVPREQIPLKLGVQR